METTENFVAGIPSLTGPRYESLSRLQATEPLNLERFARWMRDHPYAFEACDLTLPTERVLRQSFHTALATGAHSIPLGVAAVMHLYMLGAIATFPLTDPESSQWRAAMLSQIEAQRWLIANSGSDNEVRSANTGTNATTAEIMSDAWRVSGHKTFVSMATVADLLIFTATEKASSTPITLFAPLHGTKGIRLEASPLPEILGETGTRTVVMDNLVLPLANTLSGGANVSFGGAHVFQRMWFCALIPAVYLGAATAAMGEAKEFALKNLAGGEPLANLDGVTMEFGRLALALGAAFSGFEAVCRSVVAASVEPNACRLDQAADTAAAFKYTAMRAVGEVATSLRRFVGTRSMTPGSSLFRFQQESLFGSLHPELEPLMERRLGRKYLQSV